MSPIPRLRAASFAPPQTLFVGTTPVSVTVADLTGNGIPDLLVANQGSNDVSVIFGSYDGNFYALDAATGDERWRFDAGGPISGSATVLDGIVYFATLKGQTIALDAATGRKVWAFPDGRYSPVVADRTRLYLVGYQSVYAMRHR